MWKLQLFDDPGIEYRLISGKEYVVGRKDCEIIIENDKSISRKHATLTVKHPESNPCTPTSNTILEVKDVSKFGTYINRIQVDETQTLKAGDVIKFGGLNSKYKVLFQPLVVTTSSIKNNEDKKMIKTCLSQLGGHIVSDWQKETTHLIMTSLLLTIKAVCALLSAKPIVTPKYLEELLKSIQNGIDEPEIKDFLPDLGEASLSGKNIDFTPTKTRSKLFIGKTFLFASKKQLSKLQLPITFGGGEAVLISSPPTSSYLSRPGVCVISPSSDVLSQASANSWILSAENTLKKHSRRFIPESEIGLASVFCSTEKYCNPDFKIVLESMNITSQTQNFENLHSQESSFLSGRKSAEVLTDMLKVSETFLSKTSSSSLQPSTNRKHLRNSNCEDNDGPSSKIRKFENYCEDEDLFGDGSIQVIDDDNDVDNMEVETITLDYMPAKNKNLREETPEVACSFANSNWTLSERPNLESTRKPEEMEQDMSLQTPRDNNNENENNLTVIEIKSLVFSRDRLRQSELQLPSSGKNFKKFKKSEPLKARNRSICRNDMEIYYKPCNVDMTAGWSQDYSRLTTDQDTEDEDLFDWEPKRKERR